jgi:hypothetical protein
MSFLSKVGHVASKVGHAVGDVGKAVVHYGVEVPYQESGKVAHAITNKVGDGIDHAFHKVGEAVDAGFHKIGAGVVGDGFKTVFDVAGDIDKEVLNRVGGLEEKAYGWVASIPHNVERLGDSLFSDQLWKHPGDYVLRNGLNAVDLLGLTPAIEAASETLFSLKTRGLTDSEIKIAKSVFGDSIHYEQVHITEGALLGLGADRTTGHTINTVHGFNVSDLDNNASTGAATLIHELTHVWQYEHYGPDYMFRSLGDQLDGGRDGAYDYGDDAGLKAHYNDGIASFGVEEQAHIVEDYFVQREKYDPSPPPSSMAAPSTVADLQSVQLRAHFVDDASTLDYAQLTNIHPQTPYEII